ncbi:MAG: hypothetical protein ABIS13_11040 [Nitrosospira sp.]
MTLNANIADTGRSTSPNATVQKTAAAARSTIVVVYGPRERFNPPSPVVP